MDSITYKEKKYDNEKDKYKYLDYQIIISLNQEQKEIFNNGLIKNNSNFIRLNNSLAQLISHLMREREYREGIGIKKSPLERIIKIQDTRNTNRLDYLDYPGKKLSKRPGIEQIGSELEVDYLGGGQGWQILWMYYPGTDTVYVLKNLPPHIKQWVYAHERAHRRRHYTGESQNEASVDMEATATLGYNPLPNRYYGRAA